MGVANHAGSETILTIDLVFVNHPVPSFRKESESDCLDEVSNFTAFAEQLLGVFFRLPPLEEKESKDNMFTYSTVRRLFSINY